ncbi:hypothetical protein EHS25_007118 [Saitozyma podzolica]|uniref:Major facilitator superfamily (MFS) profile domain-containing protein n=1 Tax=Saitozyma podzolica TaxID=1890683 RepID=A0A427XPM1_9TREE|nr:hypothetical protein EHS25_007118 [Saitozyma podzolica]
MATIEPTRSPSKDAKNVYGDSSVVPVDGIAVEGDTAELRSRFTYEDAERLKRKADVRLLVLLSLCYLCKNIDNNVISFVPTLNKGKPTNFYNMVNISTDNFSYASTVYTACFMLAEIPSNITIKWATPRLHFSRIILLWGITCACTAAVSNAGGLFACRALLGLFEGGLWPGILYQLTCWYRPDELAVRATFLITLAQFANIIVAVLTYGLSFIDGRGMAAWQWSFVICGLFAVLLSVAVFFLLPDWPDSPPSFRQFLTPEEGAFMVARLPPGASRSTDSNFDWAAIKKDCKGGLVWSFGLMQMFFGIGTVGMSFWLPTIVSGFGLTGTSVSASTLLLIPPAVLYIITSVGFGYYLDRQTAVPKPAFMLGAVVVMIGLFFGLIFCQSPIGLYVLIMASLLIYP